VEGQFSGCVQVSDLIQPFHSKGYGTYMTLALPYIKEVVIAHLEHRDKLGTFRQPTFETVIAAEVVHGIIAEYGYEKTFAISVIELLDRPKRRTLFVVSFSGYHPNLYIDKEIANTRLESALAQHSSEALIDPKYIIVNNMDKTYFPLHQDSVEFLKRSVRADIQTVPLVVKDFGEVLAKFWDMLDGSFDYKINKNIKGILQGVCAVFLALRLDLIERHSIGKILVLANRFIIQLRNQTGLHKWKVFANVLKTCMYPSESVYKPSTVDDKHLVSAMEILWKTAGSGPYGQFCAEPKAYYYARNSLINEASGMQSGIVQGSLAMWYSRGEVRPFSSGLILGPEGHVNACIHGGYMAPCSSCKNRSSEMMLSF
jgi:hypothetical protein